MNKLQMRQVLETILGYYSFTKNANGTWTKTETNACPGYYFFNGEPFKPAFFMEGEMTVPSNWEARGLETTLVETPAIRTITRQGGINERWQTWSVWLRQWDRSKNIDDAQIAISRHFGGEAVVTMFRDNDKILGDRAKATITTKDWDLATYVSGSLVNVASSPVENSADKCYYEQ